MYNISTFSKLSNTSIQTLRYYDALELLKPGQVGKYNNYRYYTNEELIKIKIIKKLKRMGFSLKEIATILNKYDKKFLLKQKDRLQSNINSNLKSQKEIEEILKKMKHKSDFKTELVNLINKEERINVNMKDAYKSAKDKLLNCSALYHGDNFEDCLICLEELKTQIFLSNDEEIDSFWNNSAGDLFTGIALEIIKNSKEEEITFLNIFHFKVGSKEFIDALTEYTNSLDKDSYSYLSLSAISKTPQETRSGIISVFKQKMKLYAMFDTKK